jgi:hypothetical protein
VYEFYQPPTTANEFLQWTNLLALTIVNHKLRSETELLTIK